MFPKRVRRLLCQRLNTTKRNIQCEIVSARNESVSYHLVEMDKIFADYTRWGSVQASIVINASQSLLLI